MEQQRLYAFHLTQQEAQIVVAGLKKLPMEVVEGIIYSLESQFKQQSAEAPAPVPANTDEEKAQEVAQVEVPANRKARRMKKAKAA